MKKVVEWESYPRRSESVDRPTGTSAPTAFHSEPRSLHVLTPNLLPECGSCCHFPHHLISGHPSIRFVA